MAQPNPTIPNLIFGLTPLQHRELRIKEFLKYYARPFSQSDTPATLLNHLTIIEEHFSDAETLIISKWFRGGGLLSDLKPTLRKAGVHTRNFSEVLGAAPDTPGQERLDPPSDQIAPLAGEQECQVCLVTLRGDKFPRRKITARCLHAPSTCLDCIKQSLDIQIQDKPWDHISCPECPAIVSYNRMKDFASPGQFKIYDHKRHLAALQCIPNFIMCSSPTCNSGQIHPDGARNPIMKCTACSSLTCFTHKIPWHKGISCDSYNMFHKSQQEQEVASEGYLKKNAKICPNGTCGLHVQKVDGCDHIYCTHCHFEFCWACLASYNDIRTQGNTGHNPDCKYHTSQLNTPPPPVRPRPRQYRVPGYARPLRRAVV